MEPEVLGAWRVVTEDVHVLVNSRRGRVRCGTHAAAAPRPQPNFLEQEDYSSYVLYLHKSRRFTVVAAPDLNAPHSLQTRDPFKVLSRIVSYGRGRAPPPCPPPCAALAETGGLADAGRREGDDRRPHRHTRQVRLAPSLPATQNVEHRPSRVHSCWPPATPAPT